MTQPDREQAAGGPGLTGPARVVAGFAILLIAALGILVVLDAISLAMFGQYTTKILLVACIVVLASVAIGLLSRSRRS
jgi:hypothetical protein